MIYLDLFIGFLRVGLFSFGGAYAAIPLIREIVLSYGWLTDEAISYMIAVSESTPGPIMVNLATYVGSNQAGLLGSLLATTAVVLPAFLIILLAMCLLKSFISNKYVQAVMRGLKPAMIGIILATGIYLTHKRVRAQDGGIGFNGAALILMHILIFGRIFVKRVLHKKVSSIQLICAAAVLGMIIFSL